MGVAAVKMDQLSVAAYIRLQLQNTADELRGMTQTCTARSIKRSLRSGRARVVKVREFSSQILLWTFRKPISMGSFLMERIFRSTSNEVLTAHTEWLPGVRLRYSVPLVQYI